MVVHFYFIVQEFYFIVQEYRSGSVDCLHLGIMPIGNNADWK